MIAKLEVFLQFGIKVDLYLNSTDDVNRIHEIFKQNMAAKTAFNISLDIQGAQPGQPSSIVYYFIPDRIVYYGLIMLAQSPYTASVR